MPLFLLLMGQICTCTFKESTGATPVHLSKNQVKDTQLVSTLLCWQILCSGCLYHCVLHLALGDTFTYGNHVWIDLHKLYTVPYGSTTWPTTKQLHFWTRFGGFGSLQSPGQGWSGEFWHLQWQLVPKKKITLGKTSEINHRNWPRENVRGEENSFKVVTRQFIATAYLIFDPVGRFRRYPKDFPWVFNREWVNVLRSRQNYKHERLLENHLRANLILQVV